MTSHIERRWLVGIVLAGLLLRVVAVLLLHIEPVSDYLDYRTMALNLVSGVGLVDGFQNAAFFNAGYPLLIVAPAFALLGNHVLPVQLLNAVLGASSILCCYGVAKAAGAGPLGRLLAAGLLAVYVPSILYAEYLAKENLMTPLLLGAVWCAVRLAQRPSAAVAAVSGCLFGLLALTGNAALAVVPVALLGLLMSRAPVRAKLAFAVLATTLALAIAAPWMIRNARVVGAPVLNTNTGFNLYIGNNPRATGFFVSIADTPRGTTWHALREQGELYASKVLEAEALTWMAEHPSDVLRLSLRKIALFWMPPVHEGLGPESAVETLTRRVWLVQYAALLAGALLSALWAAGRTRDVALVYLAIGAYTAAHMLFYVIFRYREPVMPLVTVLAALSLERLAQLWFFKRQHHVPREA